MTGVVDPRVPRTGAGEHIPYYALTKTLLNNG